MEIYAVKDILFAILRYKWWVVTASILGIIISLGVASFVVTPKYQATAQVLVIPEKQDQNISLQNAEIQANLQLINTYKALIKSPKVLDQVKESLGDKYSLGSLKEQVESTTEENSQIINIIATMPKAKEAETLANETAKQFITVSEQMISAVKLEILSQAQVSENTTLIFPKKQNFAVLGLIGGLFVSFTFILLAMLFSTKINSEEDLVHLDQPILGTIGIIEDSFSVEQRSQNS